MQIFKEERKEQQVAMNSLAENADWDEMSDCSAEVPEEQEEEKDISTSYKNLLDIFT